ncbi:hypothetical protein BO70DRAFT_310345 [Aspergillus heteromorphus CBS 117.55]|uniref:Rhodopsin domain-containing protein n=1 Tax=Aspergillus heteromorphus CBS 117.55 TaxID=1448321 RepID=A0A317WS11_9EURO|nr:uncharacterized protein BO70DRAFT_310345 [Aspergillus heteromorphus CBS 117.55]PWY88511.1 hypothetical protein BO70DRAFT_310345 [Aspergillus heteromorphus CBS 117.55]
MSGAHLGGAGLPDVSQAPKILTATSITTMFALATVLARLYVRVFIIRNVGLDDYTMVLTMALSLSGWAIIIPEVMYGAGRHTVYVEKTATLASHLNFATQGIYMWAIGLVKISIGLFLLRFAPRRGYKIFIWAVIVLMLLYTTICFLTLIFQCKDIRSSWDLSVKSKCFAPTQLLTLSYVNTSLNILTDLILAVLPAFMLRRHLQVNQRTKASLICILGLGIFACAAAIVKLSFIANYGRTGDLLWDYSSLTIWVAVESNTGIIAGSLPTLKPLFKKVLDSYSYSYRSRSRSRSRSKTPFYNHGDSKPNPQHSLSQSRSRSRYDHNHHQHAKYDRKTPQLSTDPYPIPPSTYHGDSGNSSDEYILSFRDDSNSIMLTTEVTVSRSGGGVEGGVEVSGGKGPGRSLSVGSRYHFENMI